MDGLIQELLELHLKCEGTLETWCEECVQVGDDSGVIEHGRWPCETVQIVMRHRGEVD